MRSFDVRFIVSEHAARLTYIAGVNIRKRQPLYVSGSTAMYLHHSGTLRWDVATVNSCLSLPPSLSSK